MTSLLVTNNKRLDTDAYSVPPTNIRFHGVKLRSASILNNHYNVRGHVVTIRILSVDVPINLSDGFYSGEQYAYYLEQRLNDWSGNANWKVYFNRPALKYYISYNNPTANSVELKFNDSVKTFMGFNNDLVFPGSTKTAISSDNKVKPLEGYYRIVSHSLTSNSMAYDDAAQSGTIAIIPLTGGFGEYTQYNNTDNFYITTKSEQTIFNTLDVHIFIEDSNVEVENPIFQLHFQFV